MYWCGEYVKRRRRPFHRSHAIAHERLRMLERAGRVWFAKPKGSLQVGDWVRFLKITARGDVMIVQGCIVRQASMTTVQTQSGRKFWVANRNLLTYLLDYIHVPALEPLGKENDPVELNKALTQGCPHA